MYKVDILLHHIESAIQQAYDLDNQKYMECELGNPVDMEKYSRHLQTFGYLLHKVREMHVALQEFKDFHKKPHPGTVNEYFQFVPNTGAPPIVTCPKCGSTEVLVERRPNGDAVCVKCQHKSSYSDFYSRGG